MIVIPVVMVPMFMTFVHKRRILAIAVNGKTLINGERIGQFLTIQSLHHTQQRPFEFRSDPVD